STFNPASSSAAWKPSYALSRDGCSTICVAPITYVSPSPALLLPSLLLPVLFVALLLFAASLPPHAAKTSTLSAATITSCNHLFIYCSPSYLSTIIFHFIILFKIVRCKVFIHYSELLFIIIYFLVLLANERLFLMQFLVFLMLLLLYRYYHVHILLKQLLHNYALLCAELLILCILLHVAVLFLVHHNTIFLNGNLYGR